MARNRGVGFVPRARWWFSDPTDRRDRLVSWRQRTQHHRLETAAQLSWRTGLPAWDIGCWTVGGVISPETETPKLLWLKENLPATYGSAWNFDLADFLTWRATR